MEPVASIRGSPPNHRYLLTTDIFSNDISSVAVAGNDALHGIPDPPSSRSAVDGRRAAANGQLTAAPGIPFANSAFGADHVSSARPVSRSASILCKSYARNVAHGAIIVKRPTASLKQPSGPPRTPQVTFLYACCFLVIAIALVVGHCDSTHAGSDGPIFGERIRSHVDSPGGGIPGRPRCTGAGCKITGRSCPRCG